ncbi:MAG: dihydrolipoyl dehydrogenase [Actinomycetota bacterium]|nr:dihydrolipoyl dehydrogenase [Actinomycetota bacterium]
MADRGDSFDLVILGGGNAGYAAAFRAASLGMAVAMVEKDKVGGTCLHRGCIPTKALLHAGELTDEIRHAGDFGIIVQDEPQVDWGKVLDFKDNVVNKMYRGLQHLVKANKVELVQGEGVLAGPTTVVVDTEEGERRLKAEKAVLLAPGSYPRDLPFISADGDKVHNSNYGLIADDIPSSIIIVGGNYIGLEFASVYRSFGAEVHVVEMLDRIAPAEDLEVSKALLKALRSRGIEFHLGVSVTGAETTDSGVEIAISKDGEDGEDEKLTGDRMLVAVGRGPRTEGIGLEEAGIKLEKGFISVDETFKTSVEGVYAIGDAITVPDANWGPHPQLAHVAFIEGQNVAERLAGQNPPPVDYRNIAHCIYCQPEVASVGLTEQKAEEMGMDVVAKQYQFSANARAQMLGGGQGFVKTVAQEDGAVVGVHIVGPRASDLISEAMLVTSWEAYPAELVEIIHPHPTLSEAIGETFMELAGKPLHGSP